MGFMDKFLDAMRLNDDDDYEFDNDDYLDDDDIEEEAPRKSFFRKEKDVEEEPAPKVVKERPAPAPAPRQTNKITPIRRSSGKQGNGMEVCVIKPTSVEEEREIAETLLNGRAVVINMEGLNVDIAQRIIDFTSGATFAIRGNLYKISNYIFIATPESVGLSGDLQGLVDNLDASTFSI
ncbi:MAG: cell division protein SepF [Agathobacter sp.]|nr:cell division protein SepF [Agathobacter sp.]